MKGKTSKPPIIVRCFSTVCISFTLSCVFNNRFSSNQQLILLLLGQQKHVTPFHIISDKLALALAKETRISLLQKNNDDFAFYSVFFFIAFLSVNTTSPTISDVLPVKTEQALKKVETKATTHLPEAHSI
jgi:hypothetical protein